MAIIVIEQDLATPRQGPRNVMRLSLRLAAFAISRYRYFEQWREERAQARELASLPMDMRKDFGWPGPDRH
ncbi:hypothetical protein [Allorhizobium borbori]|uniref:DUF1127 domain-containing protein n=1 Tax=Allorhizobium borbori TaxID=485907 RepID=A0A7W6P148_9HYPH|nr:hypothetical protein [Allorhizobium borbori]MBB4103432.1 hypothetical protein [Allorhizobium borbori]